MLFIFESHLKILNKLPTLLHGTFLILPSHISLERDLELLAAPNHYNLVIEAELLKPVLLD